MKRLLLYTTLSLLLAVGSTSELGATHLIGGKLDYQQVGQDTFLVTFTAYRDCNAIALDSFQLNIDGVGFSYADSMYIHSSLGKDITPVCDSSESRCSNSSSTFPYGIERYSYTALIVLQGTGCEYRLSITECCYSTNISTTVSGGPMYFEAIINGCLSSPNSSPELADPVLITCAGSCVIGNMGAIEPDGDSLVFSLVPPLNASGTPVSYYSPYSYDKPLYFNGFPNANLPPSPPLCRGFALDPVTGSYIFRPMQSQVTVWSWGIEEYRNGVRIGYTAMTAQLLVMACPNNDIPYLVESSNALGKSITACAGQSLCFDIETRDDDISDTVALTWSNNIPGASFTVSGDTAKTGTFCWTPDSSHIRSQPYTFTVTATDNACPMVGKVTKAYSIKVVEAPEASIRIINHIGCGKYSFDVSGYNMTPAGIEWWIDSQMVATTEGYMHQFKTGGNHVAELRVKGLHCTTSYIDTLKVPLVNQLTIGPDTTVCTGNTFRINSIYSGWPVEEYNWSNGDTTSYADILVSSDTTVMLSVMDSLGCLISDTIHITATYTPWIGLGPDRNICQTSQAKLSVGVSSNYPDDTIVSWEWYDAVLNKQLSSDSTFTIGATGTYAVVVNTLYGCTATDTVMIFDQRPAVSAGSAVELCLYDTLALQGSPAGGTWTGAGITGNSFYADSAGTGNFELIYKIVDTTTGCDNQDTLAVTVFGLPNADAGNDTFICAGDTIQLQASGGMFYTWTACPELDQFNIANPNAFPDHKKTFLVLVTDYNSCKAIDSVTVDVDTACVWPGDADYDGVVNNFDLLALGLAYGNTGPVRPNASIAFTGQPAYLWDSVFASGRNQKHADCNGDSIVTAADTTAISQNYTLTHSKWRLNKRNGGIPLYFTVENDSVNISDTVTTFINLGDSATPAADVYGVAFTVTYSANLVDSGSLSFDYSMSWLGQPSELLYIAKDFYGLGKADVAITRIDQIAKAGKGRISKMTHVITDNIDGKNGNAHPLVLDISNVKLINASGDTIEASSVPDTISVLEEPSGIASKTNMSHEIQLYPNPASGMFTLQTGDISVQEVYISDMLGKQMQLKPSEVATGNLTYSVNDLNDGVYFVTVVTSKGLTVKKLLIQN
ncbi:MAG: T9SS type A sorting domain-containing protein [Bacteroidia bacterium]